MAAGFVLGEVEIREERPVRVAVLAHRGDPATVGATVRRFIAWRRAAGLVPPGSATYNVFHDDPRTTAPEAYRLDLCAATDGPVEARGEAVREGMVPGGRCAVLRVVGGDGAVGRGLDHLYRAWLPASGEAARDLPPWCRRIAFPPFVPPEAAVAELFLPLR